MAAGVGACDLVHSHTWYANLAGHLAKLLYGIPHVVTSHSLEPSRPWKAEQLGGGYALSSWAERTAYEAADAVIAVSAASMDGRARRLPGARPGAGPRRAQRDRHRALPAGARDRRARAPRHRPRPADRRRSSGGSPARRACRTCCGPRSRSTRRPRCCCSPVPPTRPSWPPRPTPRSPSCTATRDGVVLVHEALPRTDVRQVLSHSTVFVCPSVYEPLGHRQPGGDGVRHGRRGERRRRHPRGRRRRRDRAARPLRRRRRRRRSRPRSPPASTASSPTPRSPRAMGAAGRERAVREFGWDAAARRTLAIYEALGSAR